MKLDVVKICAGLVIILALLMCQGVATETTWRFSGFELYGFDINFTDHNATNVKNIDAENIISKQIGGVIYANQYNTLQEAFNAGTNIFLPDGTYTGNNLEIQNNSVVWGGESAIINPSGNGVLFNLTGKDRITLDGFTINGLYPTYSIVGIYSQHSATNITIMNMYFENISTNAIQLGGNTNLIYNNIFINLDETYAVDTVAIYMGISEIMYNQGYRSYNNHIIDNTIINYYGDAIACNLAQCKIVGNYIDAHNRHTGLASGIDIYGGGTDSIIFNNIIKNLNSGARTPGIMLNIDTNNNMPSNTRIYNNYIDSASCAGIELNGAGTHTSNNTTVLDNIITNTNISGCANGADIVATFAAHTIIKDNRISTLYDAGTSTNLTILNNYGINPFNHGNRASAPIPFGAGDEYYDSTDNIKYSYDGSNWKSLTNEYFYGEAHVYNNAVATVIETADTPIALRQITTGSLNGWTFDAGSTGAITAYADGSGGKVTVSDASHGLSNSDIITIRGTTNYNGVFTVSDVTTDAFNITDTWVADDGASDWDQGASLIAGANSAGIYTAAWQMSSAPVAAMTITWMMYINAVPQTKTTAERKYPINDKSCCASTGVLTISAGDVVWLSIQSDDTASVTNKHGNFNLHKIC